MPAIHQASLLDRAGGAVGVGVVIAIATCPTLEPSVVGVGLIPGGGTGVPSLRRRVSRRRRPVLRRRIRWRCRRPVLRRRIRWRCRRPVLRRRIRRRRRRPVLRRRVRRRRRPVLRRRIRRRRRGRATLIRVHVPGGHLRRVQVRQDLTDRRRELGHRLVAIRRRLGEAAQHQRVDARRRCSGARDDGAGAGSRRCAAMISPMPSPSNGGRPVEQVEQHAAERIDVASGDRARRRRGTARATCRPACPSARRCAS